MDHRKGRTTEIFELLVTRDLEGFLQSCHEEITVTAYGSGPTPTILGKTEIRDWWGSLMATASGSATPSIEVARSTENADIVILRYTVDGDHQAYPMELANFVAFRADRLFAWTSYPLDLSTLARAQGLSGSHQLAVV
jgi:ketosteroid isomerase-like protein